MCRVPPEHNAVLMEFIGVGCEGRSSQGTVWTMRTPVVQDVVTAWVEAADRRLERVSIYSAYTTHVHSVYDDTPRPFCFFFCARRSTGLTSTSSRTRCTSCPAPCMAAPRARVAAHGARSTRFVSQTAGFTTGNVSFLSTPHHLFLPLFTSLDPSSRICCVYVTFRQQRTSEPWSTSLATTWASATRA